MPSSHSQAHLPVEIILRAESCRAAGERPILDERDPLHAFQITRPFGHDDPERPNYESYQRANDQNSWRLIFQPTLRRAWPPRRGPRGRHLRSRYRCSMCSAIHINSRSWLRSSSTHEPSDPPLKVITLIRSFFSRRERSHQ